MTSSPRRGSQDSYSLADVEGVEEVGGLVGENEASSELTESYAAGSVDGGTNAGGAVGVNDGAVERVYRDTDATGRTDGVRSGDGDVTGLSTDEMQGESARDIMSALDFENTWMVETNPDDYPTLR